MAEWSQTPYAERHPPSRERNGAWVLSEAKKEPMTNWPGLTEMTALPTSSTIPQYSCPIGDGSGNELMPR